MTYLIVFFAYLAVDFAYASYTVSCVNQKPIVASNWSVVCYLAGAIGIASFIDNRWTVIPMLLGGWLGSFIVITRDKRKKCA